MKKFSIILLLYNAKPNKIRITLDSIFRQDLDDFEIIVSDDGSKTDSFEYLQDYFRDRQFKDYLLIKNKVNVGTVQNLLGALKKTKGEYIKAIGAGDLLYSNTTLRNVYDFMSSNHVRSCFGRMKAYSITNHNEVRKHEFNAPKDLSVYQSKSVNRVLIIKNMLLHENWISGATMFFERKMLLKCMYQVVGKVKYCEDVFQLMLFLWKERMYFLDEYVTWYEYGSGVSTGGNNTFVRAVKKDQENFICYVESRCKNKKLLRVFQERRNKACDIANLMKVKYVVEEKRWSFCLWKNNKCKIDRRNYPPGFLDKPETFLKENGTE